MRVEQRDHVVARRADAVPDGDDVADLGEGEPGGLGGPDECQPVHGAFVVRAVAGGAPLRRG